MSGGLLEIAEVILANSEKRLETVARNVANSSTAGFKRQISFEQALTNNAVDKPATQATFTDFEQAALRVTGQPFDLALSGPGFFRLRTDDGAIYYSRGGQFDRGIDGLLRNAQGMILQGSSDGDVIISDPAAEILTEGIVLERGLPVARIGVFEPTEAEQMESVGGIVFRSNTDLLESDAPSIRQGMIETANVAMASEMVTMMEALRSAEIGARVVQTYDSLVSGSITTFGRSS